MASLSLAMTTTRGHCERSEAIPLKGEGDGFAVATHDIITRPPLAEGGNRVWPLWLANGLYRTSSVPVLTAWRHAHIVLCYFYFEYRLSAV